MARRKEKVTLREVGISLLLVVTCIWLVFIIIGIFHKEQLARQTVSDTRAQLAALDARKTDLSKTVDALNTQRGQEAALRQTYGVAKPGEEVIVVVPKQDTVPPPLPTFWQKVKNAFGL